MSTIIEEFRKKSNFYCEKGALEEEIKKAERALGLRFADDYTEYLQQFGSVSCGGHELTEVSEDAELDVVKVTLKNLNRNQKVSLPLYVVEETHMDGMVIWQSESGEVFQTEYEGAPEKIFDSLLEYVSTFTNKEEDV